MNELIRPTLQVDLSVAIPNLPPLVHELDKVEVFATQLNEFYDNLLASNTLSINDIKAERTKVRKVMTTITDNRKNTVKAYKKPIQDFEDTSKRVEKILEGIDNKMKAIVDADKKALQDPFAGLSINMKKVVLRCNEEDLKLVISFAKEHNIEMEVID